MDLHQHLAKLLYQYDKVEIPGFGYFICEIVDTEIHPVEHRFHPRYKKIDFKVSKEVKGSLLMDAMLADGMTETQAKTEITKFTQQVIAELKAGKKIQFRNIGFLFVQSGSWVFEQDKTINYLPDSIGLESFVAQPVHQKLKKEAVNTDIKPVQKERKKRFPWVALTAAAVLLIISGTVYWGWNKISNYWDALDGQAALVTDTLSEEVLTNDSLPRVDDTLIIAQNDSMPVDAISPTDTALIEPQEIEEQPLEIETHRPTNNHIGIYQDKKYFLVAGCFKEEERADEFVQELIGDGFKASKEGMTKGGLHRVVYGGYDTWALAKAEIQKVKDKGREGAWIQKNN